MDATALRVWLGHADQFNMAVLGHNQTVLGAGGGYELQLQAQTAQHLIPEPQPERHTARPLRLNSGLPNPQLDEFALDDLFWNYYDNTYFA
jgi:hypothetical protein